MEWKYKSLYWYKLSFVRMNNIFIGEKFECENVCVNFKCLYLNLKY